MNDDRLNKMLRLIRELYIYLVGLHFTSECIVFTQLICSYCKNKWLKLMYAVPMIKSQKQWNLVLCCFSVLVYIVNKFIIPCYCNSWNIFTTARHTNVQSSWPLLGTPSLPLSRFDARIFFSIDLPLFVFFLSRNLFIFTQSHSITRWNAIVRPVIST